MFLFHFCCSSDAAAAAASGAGAVRPRAASAPEEWEPVKGGVEESVTPFNGASAQEELDRRLGVHFAATLERPSLLAPLGVLFDVCDDQSLEVGRVRDQAAPVQAYNSSVEPRLQLRPGLLVLSVNGVHVTDDRRCEHRHCELEQRRIDVQRMIDTLNASTRVRLGLRRPQEFTVELVRTGNLSLGLDINYAATGHSLLVQQVEPGGAVMGWNEASPDRAVQVNDQIVAVNGKMGTAYDLLQFLKEAGSGRVELRVARSA